MREMRRQDKAMNEEEAWKLLERGGYGILATADAEQIPYAVPLNYVLSDGMIYFHCAVSGHKLDNLRQNPNVCFVCVDAVEQMPSQFNTKFQSVIVFGMVEEETDEKRKMAALMRIAQKYSSRYMKAAADYAKSDFEKVRVIKIHIRHITGKEKK